MLIALKEAPLCQTVCVGGCLTITVGWYALRVLEVRLTWLTCCWEGEAYVCMYVCVYGGGAPVEHAVAMSLYQIMSQAGSLYRFV